MATTSTATAPPTPVNQEHSYEEFYRTVFARLVHLAMGFTGTRGEAEELVQDTMVVAHRNWERLASQDDAVRWARRVLVNRCISRARRMRSEARALVRIGRTRVATEDVPALDTDLWRAVRELPGKQAAAVALVYLEDASLKQVGEVLGCSAESARTHLRRAHATLANRLGTTVDPDGDERTNSSPSRTKESGR